MFKLLNAVAFRDLTDSEFMCALFSYHALLQPKLERSTRFLSRLGIRQKICLGYALSLSVAVLGTLSGFALGEYYDRQATQRKIMAHDEHQRLDDLRSTILESNPLQEYAAALNYPAAFEQARIRGLERIQRVRSLLTQVRQSAMQSLIVPYATTLYNYEHTFENMARPYEDLLRGIEVDSRSPEAASIARQRLAQLSASSQFTRLLEFADELRNLVAAAEKQEEMAILEVQDCERLRIEIAVLSMGLSGAIALGLALYISGAIARPLQEVTRVARKVAQDSDFSLRATVTTEDETGILATTLNQLIQRVSELLEEQKRDTIRQVQTEKLSSLGQLVAGVAHEINNPVNFISGNLVPVQHYVEDLLTLIEAYESGASKAEVEELEAEIDLEFVREDLPKILQSMTTGVDRVQEIALSLKSFARSDSVVPHRVNLHECLDSTLMILSHRLKIGITVIRNYGDIPTIEGYSGSLYQVFMNLLSNAIDALQDHPEPKIEISTEWLENTVQIRVADNGKGIPTEYLEQIFEAFFTTKPIGIGTGLGLSITQQIVVEKHGGRLSCTSEEGKGTTFVVDLPVESSPQLVAQG